VVFFHIGAPKTGTTYLQHVMAYNRTELRRAGLSYPSSQIAHFWASQDLRGTGFRGFVDPHVPGAWDRLVNDARGWPRRSIIGHESFATASPAQIDRALADLAFADVHLVYTARDLARQLPAVWQERIKNRSVQSYADFLSSIRAGRRSGDPGVRHFWNMHGISRVLRRWGRNVDPDHIHIVTVPPPGSARDELWRRFATLLGVEPGDYRTDVPRGLNSSLGAAEAAVLRRFNEAIADRDVPWPAYAAVFKQQIAPSLGARFDRIELPKDAYDWAVAWSERTVEALRRSGYDVVGNIDDLVPTTRPTGVDPDDVPPDQFAEAALAGMVSLVEVVMDSPIAATAVRRSQRGPVARKLEQLSGRSPAMRAVRDAYRRWRR
jgi:hypothetical protein